MKAYMKKNTFRIIFTILLFMLTFSKCTNTPQELPTNLGDRGSSDGFGESEIVIQRAKDAYASNESMRVYVNEQLSLVLNNGDEGVIIVPNGNATIYAKLNEKNKSKNLSINLNSSRITFLATIGWSWYSHNTITLEKMNEISLEKANGTKLVIGDEKKLEQTAPDPISAQTQTIGQPSYTVSSSNVSQKYALVIGNGNYTSFGRLPNALNDANDMKTTLEGLGFTVDIVIDGSRAQIVESITRLKDRLSISKNSYGFFFYAGHGLQYNGVNYLIPAKADIPNANYLGDTSISVQTMLAELNDAGNELNVIVLDACRDFPAVWNRSMNRGLTVVTNQPADSIIVFATSAGSTASDGTGRNGLFTSKLLKNLKTPGLEVSEIFRLTGADVSQASNRQQIPAVYNQFFGRAYFNTQP